VKFCQCYRVELRTRLESSKGTGYWRLTGPWPRAPVIDRWEGAVGGGRDGGGGARITPKCSYQGRSEMFLDAPRKIEFRNYLQRADRFLDIA
jgi:hypothetical protein